MPGTIPTIQPTMLQTDVPNVDTGGALRTELRTSPRANADDFAPPANNFVNLSGFEQGINQVENVLNQAQDKDNALWAQKTSLQSRVDWMTKMSDPNYSPTPEQFQQDYTDYQNKAVANAPTSQAADMAMTHMNEQALPLFQNSLAVQYQQKMQERMANIQSIANNTAQIAVGQDPETAMGTIDKALTFPGRRGSIINEGDKLGIKQGVLSEIAQKNPQSILDWKQRVAGSAPINNSPDNTPFSPARLTVYNDQEDKFGSQTAAPGPDGKYQAQEGVTIGTDPNIIPFGSRVQIPSLAGKFPNNPEGIFTAHDTGSDVISQKASGGTKPVIDVYTNSKDTDAVNAALGQDIQYKVLSGPAPFIFPGSGLNAKQSAQLLSSAQLSKSTSQLQGAVPSEIGNIEHDATPNLIGGVDAKGNPTGDLGKFHAMIRDAGSAMATDGIPYFSGRPEIQAATQALQQIKSDPNADPQKVMDATNRVLAMNIDAQQEARQEAPGLFGRAPVQVYSNQDASDMVRRFEGSNDPVQQMQILNEAKSKAGNYWDAYGSAQMAKAGLPFNAQLAMQTANPATASLLLHAASDPDVANAAKNDKPMVEKLGKAYDTLPMSSAVSTILSPSGSPLGSSTQFKNAAIQLALTSNIVSTDPEGAMKWASEKIMGNTYQKIDTHGSPVYASKTLGFSPNDLSTIAGNLNDEKSSIYLTEKAKGAALQGTDIDSHNALMTNIANAKWVNAPSKYVPQGQNPKDYVALMASPDGATNRFIQENGAPLIRSLSQMKTQKINIAPPLRRNTLSGTTPPNIPQVNQ